MTSRQPISTLWCFGFLCAPFTATTCDTGRKVNSSVAPRSGWNCSMWHARAHAHSMTHFYYRPRPTLWVKNIRTKLFVVLSQLLTVLVDRTVGYARSLIGYCHHCVLCLTVTLCAVVERHILQHKFLNKKLSYCCDSRSYCMQEYDRLKQINYCVRYSLWSRSVSTCE